VSYATADLTDLAAGADPADELSAYGPIDVLVNNAGGNYGGRGHGLADLAAMWGVAQIPMGRPGTAYEIVAAVGYLASSAAGWTTVRSSGSTVEPCSDGADHPPYDGEHGVWPV
jgi:NAD(P)-dependent dehydrogenase (short-subunit alcohol dehydrogenase family)